MENERFDDLIKRVGTTRVTRGAALRGLLGGGAAVLLGTALSPDGADARRNHRRRVSRKAVAVDGGTCKGFVGKGDVQTLFGWNNQQLQANASGITFAYDATDTYSATCTFVTGAGTRGEQTHDVPIPRHTAVKSTITYDARTQKQITGFTLTGCGTTTTEGTVPVVGDACVANEEGVARNGTWSAVTFVSSSGGLFVSYGGITYPLPNTPTV